MRFVGKSCHRIDIFLNKVIQFYLNNTINLRHLYQRIKSCYTHKTTIVLWPRTMWRHFQAMLRRPRGCRCSGTGWRHSLGLYLLVPPLLWNCLTLNDISFPSHYLPSRTVKVAHTRYRTASRLRFEPWPFWAWFQHANHSAIEPPSRTVVLAIAFYCLGNFKNVCVDDDDDFVLCIGLDLS